VGERPFARGRRGHYRRRYPETSSLEPKMEESTQDQVPAQNYTNNGDASIDDVDSNDITRLETSLPMIDLTTLSPRIEQVDGLYPDDSVMDTDDTIQEAGTSLGNLPVLAIGDQGSDQNWEDSYAIEEPMTEALSAPQSTSQLASANTGTLNPIFNVADDSMADVTANPWTSL